MRIYEVLFWRNESTEEVPFDPQLNLHPVPYTDDLTNLANACTRRGLVKRLWNMTD
jgi:hypothetical protein